MATITAAGALDELVALHDELGVFQTLDAIEVERERAGVPATSNVTSAPLA